MNENLQEFSTTVPARTVEVVTLEIKTLHHQAQQAMLTYAIEIGRRLIEVKELLPHGEWGNYLKTQVEYSQSTANNFMRLFEEYGSAQNSIFGAEPNSQSLGNLPYTKALALIAIPSEEREEFAEKHNVEDISTRELNALIKARDEAQREADDVTATLHDTEVSLQEAATERDAAKEAVQRLERELEELRSAPIDVAVETVVDENAIEQAKAEARKQAEADMADKIQKAKDAKKKAEEKLKEIQERQAASEKALADTTAEMTAKVETLEKQLKVAGNQELVSFKHYFEGMQDNFNKMLGRLEELKENGDAENLSRFKNAAAALVEIDRKSTRLNSSH